MYALARCILGMVALVSASAALAQVPSPSPVPPPGPALTKTPAALSFNYAVHFAKYAEALRAGDLTEATRRFSEFGKALHRYRIAKIRGVIEPDLPACSGCVGLDEPPIDGIAPLSGAITALPVPSSGGSVGAITPPNSTMLQTLSSVNRTAARDFALQASQNPALKFNPQVVTPPGGPTAVVAADIGATKLGVDIIVDALGRLLNPIFGGVAPTPAPVPAPPSWGPNTPLGLGY